MRRLKTNLPTPLRPRSGPTLQIPVTFHRSHVAIRFESKHQPVQVFYIAKFYVNNKTVKVRFSVDENQIRDVGFLLADQGTDLA